MCEDSSTPCSLDDSRIERSIQRKRLHSVGFRNMRFTDNNERKLFEHIMVVGVPPNSPDLTPRILFLYPSAPLLFQEDDFQQTVSFCFPDGVHEIKSVYSRHTMLRSEFVFRLNGSAHTIYGICNHFQVNPRRLPFFSSESTQKYTFCFCILTANPVLSVHFHYITYLSYLFARVCDPSKRQKMIPSNYTDEPSLSYLLVEDNCARWPETRFPDTFLNELKYYQTFHSTLDRDRKYSLSDDGMTLVFPHTMTDALSMAMPSLDVLFSCLSIYDIVKLYTAILLEHHIIFVSKNLHNLTVAVLAARAIISPFKIGATLLPIIPNDPDLLALLESPVPYIVGIKSKKNLENITLPENHCLVKLDSGKLTDPELNVKLPCHGDLIQKLNAALNEYHNLIEVPCKRSKVRTNNKARYTQEYADFINGIHPYMRPPKYLITIETKFVFIPPLVENILQIFSQHLAPVLEGLIKPCFVTDSTELSRPVTIFNQEMFLANVKSREREFYQCFLTTTIFQEFCDGKTDEIDEMKTLASTDMLIGDSEPSSYVYGDSPVIADLNDESTDEHAGSYPVSSMDHLGEITV